MGSGNWGTSVAAARSVLRLCLLSRGTRHRDVEGRGGGFEDVSSPRSSA